MTEDDLSTRSFRIALVGCGRISKTHFEALKKVDGLAVTAVCDIDAARAQSSGEALGVPWYRTLDEMLRTSGPEIDVVSICTPSGLHAAQGAVVARAGKHVVSEKPMALSLAQADSLMRACEAAGVQLFVVKQNRLNPPIQLVKRAIDKERFGRIYLANVTVRWQRAQEYYDAEPWRGTWEFDGGAIMNQA